MGARPPLAGTHAGALVKRPGKIMLPQVAQFVRDFFDRMVPREQQLLGAVHPEANQHALRRDAEQFAKTVPERIVGGVQAEKHRPR